MGGMTKHDTDYLKMDFKKTPAFAYSTKEGGKYKRWIDGILSPNDFKKRSNKYVIMRNKRVYSLIFAQYDLFGTILRWQKWDCINGWGNCGLAPRRLGGREYVGV